MCAIYVNFVDIFDTDRLGLQTFSAADDQELAEDFARVEWPLAWGNAPLSREVCNVVVALHDSGGCCCAGAASLNLERARPTQRLKSNRSHLGFGNFMSQSFNFTDAI